MKTHFLTTTTLVLMVGLSTTSNAAIVDALDHTYLTDTASSLDWLDVTASVNQSYNYVSSQFGSGAAYDGWRYATADEFNLLVSNYTGVPIPVGTYTQVQHATDLSGLVDLFGVTQTGRMGPTLRETQGMIDKRYFNDQRIAVLFDYVSPPIGYYDISNTDQYISGLDASASQYGSFLVRTAIPRLTEEQPPLTELPPSAVPIPAAAFMFAPALLGFMGLRRKAKNKAV